MTEQKNERKNAENENYTYSFRWGKCNFMSRLTKYRDDIQAYDYIELCGGISQAVTNKLGKLEDLEEQLGCPLEVLFKALKDGIYYQDGILIHITPSDDTPIVLNFNEGYPVLECMKKTKDIIYTTQCCYDMWVSDYKKTWWLKEDKSE